MSTLAAELKRRAAQIYQIIEEIERLENGALSLHDIAADYDEALCQITKLVEKEPMAAKIAQAALDRYAPRQH